METFYQDRYIECGCDEVGRGCIAGPVTAAAVIWPKDIHHPLLKDSKKLNANQRLEMFDFIREHATAYHVSSVEPEIIDKINILQASFKAMHYAIERLSLEPEFLIVDGNKFAKYKEVPYRTFVKGDNKFLSIAAASILAKVTRDHEMILHSKTYPSYDWENNKGYGTRKHIDGIKRVGFSPLHRKSFHIKALEKTLFD